MPQGIQKGFIELFNLFFLTLIELSMMGEAEWCCGAVKEGRRSW